MISDQQRWLRRQSLPTGRLQPEVIPTQEIPDRLLNPHRCLVGPVEGVLGRGGDTLADQALEFPLGSPGAASWLRHRGRIEGRPATGLLGTRRTRERTAALGNGSQWRPSGMSFFHDWW